MLRDFVLETTDAPGTSTTITLAGAATGPFCRFRDQFSSGDPVYFTITDNATQSQSFRGTLTTGTPDTLDVLETFKSTSGNTTRLNFTGTCYVSCWLPAARAIFVDDSGTAPIPGTTAIGNAASGNIGEFLSSNVAAGSAVSAAGGAAKDVTSLSLSAGDWDVSGNIVFLPSTGDTLSQIIGWLGTTSATIPTQPNAGGFSELQASFVTSAIQQIPIGPMRLNVAGSTTVYLSGYHTFTGGGPVKLYGYLRARRMR